MIPYCKRKANYYLIFLIVIVIIIAFFFITMAFLHTKMPPAESQAIFSIATNDILQKDISSPATSSSIISQRVIEVDNLVNNNQVKLLTNNDILPTIKMNIIHSVPFTSQAPLANWDDDRLQDGCEEASVLMAIKWANKENLNSNEALSIILNAADYTKNKYGEYRDTDLEAVLNWLIKDYFKYQQAEIRKNVIITDLIDILESGNLIIMPANGQALKNPHFKQPGPLNHMLVIRGYNFDNKTFITNDPGTRHGNLYEYPEDILYSALRTYPTGYHEKNLSPNKDVIVISR